VFPKRPFSGKRVIFRVKGLRPGVLAIGAVGLASLCSPGARAQTFQPGNLVVVSYGSSAASSLDGQPTPITLIEYSPSGGAAVGSFTLPTTDGVGGSANLGVVGEYGSSSEGNIQQTGDGQFLTLGAYGATGASLGIQAATDAANNSSFPLGTPYSGQSIALGQSADTDVPRIAIRIDNGGNVNSSTVFNDLFNTNNPRSVYIKDESSLYISGQGDGLNTDEGIFNAPIGLNTVTSSGRPAGIFNSVDTRFVTGFGANLYFSVDKKAVMTGIFEFAGFPTSTATPTGITPANNGLSGSSEVNYSPEGFFFANATTLYVADTGQPKNKSGSVAGAGGIQKWVLSGGTWSLQYIFNNPSSFVSRSTAPRAITGETGFEAITGQVVGTTVTLYAISYTAADDEGDGLYAVTDTLSETSNPGTVPTELESAPGSGGVVFKGVAIAPSPPQASDTPAMPWPAMVVLAAMLACVGYLALPKARAV
jgi:hypothetical protein